MKLVIAIMSKEDASMVVPALTEERIQVTKLSTAGGFLRAKNMTLLIGAKDHDVDKIISIISEYSSKRKQLLPNSMPPELGISTVLPFEVTVGGATIFVVDVDRYKKV